MKICRCIKCNRGWYEDSTTTLSGTNSLTACDFYISNYIFMTSTQEKEYFNKLNKKE